MNEPSTILQQRPIPLPLPNSPRTAPLRFGRQWKLTVRSSLKNAPLCLFSFVNTRESSNGVARMEPCGAGCDVCSLGKYAYHAKAEANIANSAPPAMWANLFSDHWSLAMLKVADG